MNLVTNMRGGTAAEESSLFDDNDRPARLRDQCSRRETGQAASNHQHIRVRALQNVVYPFLMLPVSGKSVTCSGDISHFEFVTNRPVK